MSEQEQKEVSRETQELQEQLVRNDPVNRHADGAAMGTSLVGRRPDRKYVLVNMGDTTFGPAFYQELGYKVERNDKQGRGVRLLAASTGKDGDPILFRGHVLMSVEKEHADRIKSKGAPMAGLGQEHWDKIEKTINSKRFDPIRNVAGRQHMHVLNESSDSAVVQRVGGNV